MSRVLIADDHAVVRASKAAQALVWRQAILLQLRFLLAAPVGDE
jgi:hypothetical protein